VQTSQEKFVRILRTFDPRVDDVDTEPADTLGDRLRRLGAGIVVLRLHTPTSNLQIRRLVSFFTAQAESVARQALDPRRDPSTRLDVLSVSFLNCRRRGRRLGGTRVAGGGASAPPQVSTGPRFIVAVLHGDHDRKPR
jgi:hypothetical protein